MRVKTTNVFINNFESTKRIVINRGGTRSGKTYALCQIAAVWLMTGQVRRNLQVKSGKFSIVRKYRATISSTVEKDFIEVLNNITIDDAPIIQYINVNKSRKEYTFDGRVVVFAGADDEQKLRGFKSDILYCNEANELGFKSEFFQLMIRTKHLIILDFNPSDEYVWINQELEKKRQYIEKDVEVIVSTYQDNSTLTDAQVKEIELLEKTDPELWEVYGKGQYGKVKGLIFDDWQICESVPQDYKWKVYGLDFGFTIDPTALIEVVYANGELYLNEVIYQSGLLTSDLIDEFEQILTKRDLIIADSAEPRTIAEIRKHKFNIRPAEKGRDSIKYGLNLLKRFKINITASSKNLIKEFTVYKNKTDRSGNTLDVPIDNFNHGIDAIRYATTYKIPRSKDDSGKLRAATSF